MSQQKAFTLIEMLVTISIVALLASFVFVQTNNSINDGKDVKRKADIELLANALVSYSADHYSSKPIDADGCDIGVDCSTEIEDSLKAYLPTLPEDPNSNTHYKYRSNGTDCFISAALSTGETFEYACTANDATDGPPTPGACGTSANTPATGYAVTVTEWPATNFCSEGTANPALPVFPAEGASTNWTCIGDFLGSTAPCVAYHAQNGTCGVANKRYADSASSYGTDTICGVGSASPASPAFPAKGASTTWSCLGVNGGTTATCTAEHTGNAVCGTANRTTATAYATSASSFGSDTFCALGTTTNPAFPAAGGTVAWTCAGLLGGTNASCNSYHSADGSCGTRNKTYADAATSYGTDTACATGTSSPASPAFPAKGGSTTWTCLKTYNGADASCTANRSLNGVCGAAAKTYAADATVYTGAFCTAGTAAPASPAFPAQGGSTTWSCNGSNGGTNVSCTATRNVPSPTNGVCGTANKTYTYNVTTYGSDTFCASGVANPTSPTFPILRVEWAYHGSTWTCAGINGGSDASCIAYRRTYQADCVDSGGLWYLEYGEYYYNNGVLVNGHCTYTPGTYIYCSPCYSNTCQGYWSAASYGSRWSNDWCSGDITGNCCSVTNVP